MHILNDRFCTSGSSAFWAACTALTALTLGGCSNTFNYAHHPGEQDSAPQVTLNVDAIRNAVPRVEPPAKYGNPETYEVFGVTYRPLKSNQGFVERGIGSWYGTKFHGRRTSSGEPYDMYAMTAAHKTLPLPTYVEVTNLENGKSIIVKVNDRGPFHDGRIIDLSYAAAMKIGYGNKGTAPVEIRAIDPLRPNAHRQAPRTQLVQAAPVQARPTPVATPNTPAVATPTVSNMYLQVGAFSSRSNAETLRNLISDMSDGLPVLISQINNEAQAPFRVRVGPLDSEQEAEKVSAMLTMIGINTPSRVFD